MYPPSVPQRRLHEAIKRVYTDAELDYKLLNYALDVGIPSLRIDVEYDTDWTHPDPAKDARRDAIVKAMGWRVVRVTKATIDFICADPTRLKYL